MREKHDLLTHMQCWGRMEDYSQGAVHRINLPQIVVCGDQPVRLSSASARLTGYCEESVS